MRGDDLLAMSPDRLAGAADAATARVDETAPVVQALFLGSCSEPDSEGCECDGTEVDIGAFLIAGGDGAEAFEAVDGAFYGVAFLVALAVETSGPTASGTSVLAMILLVGNPQLVRRGSAPPADPGRPGGGRDASSSTPSNSGPVFCGNESR
ncbi:hypothetical protein ACIP4W_26350 [Streptomyces sp. NPDC088846]|uniref:hypothetical protein n=1 Tax=Streptomyces sp. NPDC088846 TaxID=3365908 RepID=UPI0037F19B35